MNRAAAIRFPHSAAYLFGSSRQDQPRGGRRTSLSDCDVPHVGVAIGYRISELKVNVLYGQLTQLTLS